MEELDKPEKKPKEKPYLIEDYILTLGKQSERFLELFKRKVLNSSKKPSTHSDFDKIWKSLLEDK